MDPAIRQALTWSILGIAVVMFVFTVADLSAGPASTAMWIGAGAWLLTGGIAGWILRANPYRSEDRED